jgi:hypothetical protein
MSCPSQPRTRATVADPFLDLRHQPLVRDAVEVALEVGVDHEGVTVLDQPVHFAQRVMAAASRPEAVALRTERRLEDRFDDELHRRLDDAVLDRRDTQRPRPAIALGDVNPSDGLRPIRVFPQRPRQLGQIRLRPRREPFDAHAIHAGRAAVGPDTRPGRRQRRRCVHLVHQTVPPSSFDAVVQRRHHALRPHRRFNPRPVAGFCTPSSPKGHCRCCRLRPPSLHASTFLPAFPRPGFALRASRGPRHPCAGRCGTMRALTPAALARARQVSPLAPLCLPDIPPPTTRCAATSLSQSPQRVPSAPIPVPGFALDEQARRHIMPNRVRHPAGCPFASGCSPPRLAATQLPSATCVVTSHGKDSHLADRASSRTHSSSRTRRSIVDVSLQENGSPLSRGCQ